MSHSFHAQKRKEKFYKLAKEQGYRSRAAFKLIQLNKKFNFLGGARACLDLCAAPGGWLQVASKNMPVQSLLIGVDLLPIKPLPNVTTFVEDITTQSCRSTIRKQLQGWQVDLVLHDGAPNVGGGNTWARDAYIQIELVLHSLKLATEFLVEGGTFVTKVFRSNDYLALVWVLKQFFKKVEVTKPVASRSASAEIFVVCLGYLAPKKIDPKLFDPQILFKPTQMIEDREADKISEHSKKPNRGGYDTDKQIIFTKKPISEFLDAKLPARFLGTANELYFDEDTEIFRTHPSTKSEIFELIKDLKVLGVHDFSILMRWQKKMNRYRDELEEAKKMEELETQGDDVTVESVAGTTTGDQDEQRYQSLAELASFAKARAIKLKKKKQEAHMKELRRLALNANNIKERISDDSEALFNIKHIRNREDLDLLLQDTTQEQRDALIEMLGREKFLEIISTAPTDVNVSDDEQFEDSSEEEGSDADENYLREMEKSMNYYYQHYTQAREEGGKKKKSKRHLGLEEESAISLDREESDNDQVDALQKAKKQSEMSKSSLDMLEKTDVDQSVHTSRWFSQDAFEGISYEDDSMIPQSIKDRHAQLNAVKRDNSHLPTYDSDDDSDDDSDGLSDDDDEEEEEQNSRGRWLANDPKKPMMGSKFATGGADGFEEVKVSDYSDDTDSRAEVLALGTKMLRKKQRNAMIDAAYNKYAHNDRDKLPEWFVDDENKHNRTQLPVTKTEVDALRAQLKAINARPIRKIAEARARKKKGALRKIERAKIQANSIIEQEGVSAAEKMKQIDKLYQASRAKLKSKPSKHYIVSSKSGNSNEARSKVKGGAGKPFTVRVDRRMKKDKRSAAVAEKKKKKQKRN